MVSSGEESTEEREEVKQLNTISQKYKRLSVNNDPIVKKLNLRLQSQQGMIEEEEY